MVPVGLYGGGLGSHQVELVKLDNDADPAQRLGGKRRQISQWHGFFVRLPVVASFGNALQRAPRHIGFAIEFCQEKLGELHVLSPEWSRL